MIARRQPRRNSLLIVFLLIAITAAVAVALWTAGSSEALSTTLVPNQDKANAGGWQTNGGTSCTTTLTTCSVLVDEDIDTPTDSSDFSVRNDQGSTGNTVEFHLTDPSAPTATYALHVRVRARENPSDSTNGQLRFQLFDNADVQILDSGTFAITDSYVNYQSLVVNASLTTAQLNGLYVRLTASRSGSSGTPDVQVSTINVDLQNQEPNPELEASCGLDIALVLDSSGSVDNTELTTMKNAMNGFVNAFLPDTPTEMAVIDFDTDADVVEPFTDNVSDLTGAINGVTSGGTTNWDDALFDARNLFPNRAEAPDLIIFSSDGNPTAWGGHLGDPNTSDSPGMTSIMRAIAEANLAKLSDIRIISLGIGNDLTTANLEAVSSSDAVITSGFDQLADDLAALAAELCGGTITVQKVIDLDGNPATTGDQSDGTGWTFTTNVDAPDSSTPPSGNTNGGGMINFDIDLGGDNTAIVDITETTQTGYILTSKNCTEDNNPVGTPSGNSVNDILIGSQDIVNCKFYNQPTTTFTVNKDFSDNNVANVTVALSCSSGTVANDDTTASEADPANFTVTGFAPGSTCTATETIPSGYSAVQTNCANVTIVAGVNASCTIVNNANGTIVVQKTTNPSASAQSFTVNLTGPVNSSGSVTDAADQFFIDLPAGTYSLAEVVPAGWQQTGASCSDSSPLNAIGLSTGETVTCTFSNETVATFNVQKDFQPDNGGTVNVTLSCASGSVATNDGTASEADDANFTVTGFSGNPNCTANESGVPAGYTTNSCAALLNAGGCTIINTQTTANFNVNKDFVPNAGGSVTVGLTCASGTVSSSDTSASEADDANFTVTGFVGDPNCTATETAVPAGYDSTGTCSAALSAGSCTIVNTLRTAQLVVNKDFSDNNPANVTIAVVCTSGSVANDDTSASESDPANFTITGFDAGATCTATETPPLGYTPNQAACVSVPITHNGTASCTITNIFNAATFNVNKDFVPNAGGSVTVSLSCASGAAVPTDPSASEADDANFAVTGYAGDPLCTATETPIPAGYSSSGTCAALLSVGSCTIVNTLNTATLVVNKDFVPNAGGTVNVSVTCSTGTVANDDPTASEADPANFTINGFTPPATCTATETVPSGYSADQTNCANVSISIGGGSSCTITNYLLGTIIVQKTTNPSGSAQSFTVNLTGPVNSGGSVTDATDQFFIDLPAGTYSLSEVVPAGWQQTGASCSDSSPLNAIDVAQGETVTCVFSNETVATFSVQKDFIPDNAGSVNVTLSCASGTVTTNDGTASEADDANFTVTGFSGDPLCTANESGVPAGYTVNSCAALLSLGGCTIINAQTSANFNVNKDFVPNAAGSVTVSLSCASGIASPTDPTASEADDANFTVLGFVGNPLCTATEAPIPAGYDSTGTCAAALSAGSCTIVNTLRTAQLVVNKDFSDNNAANVSIAVLCTSGSVANDDTSASEADPANFTVTGFDAGATCTATETPVPGYTPNQAACVNVPITHNGSASCTITNTPTTATFNVNKDFVPNAAGSVTVGPTCASGTVVPVDTSASEADDANFTVTLFVGDPNCTATESTVPAGYDSTGSCSAALSAGSCTIVNNLRTAFIVVNKDFSDNNPANVTISVTCSSGTVANDDTTASEADPANFTVTAFDAGATCTATEGVPAGYTANQAPCANLSITHSGTATCTITNTPTITPFTVSKDFSDDNPADVTVSLSCASGTTSSSDNTASEADTADFTVIGAVGNPLCTATESSVPAGYAVSQCQATLSAGTCTIVNNAVATFTVLKDFTDNSAASVTVSLVCTSGTDMPATASASEATPAAFTVTGYGPGPQSCTATESPVPAGYDSTGTCTGVISNFAGTCTITNTRRTAQVVVNKDFSDNNPANVTISVSCSSGGVANDDTTASEADPANFTVTLFDAGATCTATEGVPAGYTANQAPCANVSITHAGTATCTITNTQTTAPFTVSKNFSDDNPADVTVSLSCVSGTTSSSDNTASEADTADFTVSGAVGNPLCTATESNVPAGYAVSQCQATLSAGTCTIVNNAVATFTVLKDFTDNAAASVSVSLVCSSGTDTPATASASEATPAAFTVTGYGPGPQSCTATESPVPPGYSSSGTCTGVISNFAGTCTIVNQPTIVGGIVPFYVAKDFTDNNPMDVTVNLTCTPGSVLTVIDNTASETDLAEFSVDNQPGTTCSATEIVPLGYSADLSGCQNVVVAQLQCTVINSPGAVGGIVDLPVPGDTDGSRCCDTLLAIAAAAMAAAVACGSAGVVLRRR